MSWQATGWASQLPETVVNAGPFRVLMLLANVATEDGTAAWPLVSTMAETLGVSERTVQRRLVELRESGLITLGDQRLVDHLRADRRPTVYDLALPSRKRGDRPVTPRGVTAPSRGDTQRSDGVTPAVARTTHEPPTTDVPAQPTTRTRSRRELEEQAAGFWCNGCGLQHDPLLTRCGDYTPPPPGWRGAGVADTPSPHDQQLPLRACWQCGRTDELDDDGECHSCAPADRPLSATREESTTA